MTDIDNKLLILTCDVLEYLYKQSLEEQRKEEEVRKKRSRKDKIWTRKWILRRNERGLSNTLFKELAEEDPREYRNLLRLTQDDFDELLKMLSPDLQKQDTHLRDATPLNLKLEVTLRYLATGDSLRSIGAAFRIPAGSISKFLPEMLDDIKDKLSQFMKVPTTAAHWIKEGKKYQKRWQFPRCVGAMDGKHIRIKCPGKTGSVFRNYKGYFSVILMAVVDAEYNFTYVSIGGNGRAGDSGIWAECSLKKAIEDGTLNFPADHVIVADDAFPLKTYIMKPYSRSKRLTSRQKVFNYRLSRARRIVENAFGILAWRFQIFQRAIDLKITSVDKVIWAACSLHNWLRKLNPKNTISLADFEDRNTGNVTPGPWHQVVRYDPLQAGRSNNNYSRGAENVRKEYARYFWEEGSIPWQWEQAGVSEIMSDEDNSEIEDDPGQNSEVEDGQSENSEEDDAN